MSIDRRAAIRFFSVALVCALALGLVFQRQILSGFDLVFSDRTDGIIEIALLDHWHRVFLGDAHWSSVGYFHPHARTLGYNDGYFLYGVIFTVFRRLAADPFLAVTLTHMTVKSIGFIACWRLLLERAQVPHGWALLGALLFTIANNSLLQALHGQLLSIAFAPLLLLWLARFHEALVAGHQSTALRWGASSAALVAMWLTTTFYMAYFTLFFLCVLVLLVHFKTPDREARIAVLRRNGVVLIALGLLFLLLIVPFLSIYLAKISETGGHSYSAARHYTPTIFSVLNVGEGNIVWGSAVAWLKAAFAPRIADEYEQMVGFPYLLLAAFGAAVLYFRSADEKGGARIWFLFSLAVLLIMLLTLRFGDKFSLWAGIFYAVPGAKGMRVVSRYLIFLSLPITLVATVFLHRISQRTSRLWVYPLAALLVAEQINAASPTLMRKGEQLAALDAVPPPPADCAILAVRQARLMDKAWDNPVVPRLYPHNVDAMYLAQIYRRTTINGFASFNPPDWDFADATAPDYPDRLRRYTKSH